ncbi:LamG-like jellyroll fold domain-containing protein [Flavobacterium sp. I-STPA6A]|uniref:LamG-like jellyroll fold domain-containing protein n=1 Tax=Flavobacterium sp. I-STPA6A TaxID=2590450 RepID=UPI00131C308E|nr:LamG-like jellyroll fold domain-containing protein [Flavobacterium sp. I-STPA6A]
MKKLLHQFCLFFCFVHCLNLSAQSGKVLNLDGVNTYMSVADHPDLDFGISQNKTITCWVKTTTSTGTPRIFAKRNGSSGNGYEFWTGSGGNAGKFALNMQGTGTPNSISTAGYSSTSIADATWHHVALVLDASSSRTLSGYLDGVLVNTGKTFSGTSDFSNALSFIVGATSDATNSFKWAGQIDNIRIWNLAMTATELQADMVTTITGPTTNLLGAWDFENVSGTTVPDVSGNNHPGTLFGSPTTPNAFPIVLALDGINDYMSVANHSDFNLAAGQSLTVTCRVKTADFNKRILSKRPGGSGIGYEFINNSSTGGQFGVNLTTSAGSAGPPFGTTTIADNVWHHLAMVIDVATTSCKIYVDGTLQQTKTTANIGGTNTVSNTGNLFFGTLNSLSSFMNGQLDDIRFWNKAMTATEVLTDKTAIVIGTEANLLAAWDFENISGTTVPDISGHNHPGTLNGGATVIAQSNTMQINSVALVQTELPTGMGDTDQRIVAVKVSANGSLSPLSVSALKFTMAGTTNIADVTNIKVYSNGTTAVFNLATATLFGSTAPATGALAVTGSKALVPGDNYFFITYDVAAGATEGNLLDATCESIVANSVTYNSVVNTVTGNRVILLANTLLFTPGDAGSTSYRIPAIITAADGSLVTVTDKRWNHAGDLAAKIDPVVRRSIDNGKTWSAPLTIANFGGPNGAGDAALVMDKATGNLICLFVAEKGFFASTATAPIKIQYCRSTDNGITWGAPVDITNQIYGAGCSNPITQNWLGVFIGAGRAHQLRDGTIVAALVVRETSGGINNYMMSSTDGGITWTPSTGRAETGGDEAKIVELNNGNLMMSIRNSGTRRFNISTDKGLTWGTAYNQADLTDPNCDGDFIRYTSTLDGYDKNRLLHTIPFAGNRTNVSVLMSTDEGASWPVRKTIFSGASAYSSITVLPDGTMGIYYENGENSTYQMYFTRFSLKWLTNGADTYTAPNSAVSFSSIPQDMQFYGRDNQNLATVKVAGTVAIPNLDKIKVDFYRDAVFVKTVDQNLVYTSGSAPFDLSGTIKAELAQYKIIVSTIDLLGNVNVVAERKDLLAGDAYVIMGQSNSHPTRVGYTYTNPFLRSYGIQTNNTNYDAYNSNDPNQHLWGLGQANQIGVVSSTNPTYFAGSYMVGVWGLEMMDKLSTTLQIPICVINGGAGSSSIEQNLPSTTNRLDLPTVYGRTLYRVQKAGLKNNIKAVFWHQGEKNADGTFTNYPTNFETMYNAWKTDFPSLSKVYVFQTNLNGCYGGASVNQAKMREWQRTLPLTHADITVFPMAGTPGMNAGDGNEIPYCHYGLQGYKTMGDRVAQVLEKDLYNLPSTENPLAPNIIKAFYSKSDNTQIRLVFDNNNLVAQSNVGTYNLKDYFYLDGVSGNVSSLSVIGNTVVLNLTIPSAAQKISYLSNSLYNDNSTVYAGPYLTNTKNIGALTFNDYPLSLFPVKAYDDQIATNEDTPVTIAVTANDTDAHGTIEVATVDLDPDTSGIQTTFSVSGEGTYSVDALGTVTFTPVLNYNGIALPIYYTVNNSLGLVSNSAIINVIVTAVNDVPVAVNDSKSTNEDTPVTIAIKTNDTDADGTIDGTTVDLDQALSGIQITFTATNEGTYSVDASGIVTFTPVLNYNGVATPVNYTVNDNLGLTSNSAKINITVTAVNDVPVAIDDLKTTIENTPVTIAVTINDNDVDGTIDPATVDLNPATSGIQTTLSVAGEGTYAVDALGTVTFTPVLNYNGAATAVNYTVQDNLGLVSNSATINVTVNPNTTLNTNDFNIAARSSISSFPNPTTGRFEISLPTARKEVLIELYTMTSQLISKSVYPVVNNLVRLSVENEASGVYMAKIYLEKVVNIKIIKK